MHVFVANPSLQHRHFMYRVLEAATLRRLEIRAKCQAQVPGDFEGANLTSLVKQLEGFGAVPANDPRSITRPYALIYKVEASKTRPIASDQINEAMERDAEARQERAAQETENTGKANFVAVSGSAPGRVQSTALEVEQLTDREEDPELVKGGVNYEIEVSKSAPVSGKVETKRDGSGRRRRR